MEEFLSTNAAKRPLQLVPKPPKPRRGRWPAGVGLALLLAGVGLCSYPSWKHRPANIAEASAIQQSSPATQGSLSSLTDRFVQDFHRWSAEVNGADGAAAANRHAAEAAVHAYRYAATEARLSGLEAAGSNGVAVGN